MKGIPKYYKGLLNHNRSADTKRIVIFTTINTTNKKERTLDERGNLRRKMRRGNKERSRRRREARENILKSTRKW